MTREELFPKSLVRRTPSYKVNIDHSRPKKPPQAIQVVRDVCARCNNVLLGALDAYAAKLMDKYFDVLLEKPPNVDFECDTERLLRWLLKLLFNSARISKSPTDAYRSVCPFILGDNADPGIMINLLVGLMEPFNIPGSKELSYPTHQGFSDFALTDFGLGVPAQVYSTLCGGVFLNSYVFCIIAWRQQVARPMRRRVLRLMKENLLTDLPRPNCSVHLSGACMSTAALMRATLDGNIVFGKDWYR